MRGRIPLQQGEIFNEADLVGSRTLLENEFQNRGYVYAQVLLEYRIDKQARTARVIYSVGGGQMHRRTRIEATSRDLDSSAASSLPQ
jgi:outer membrane protein assembly factor BamA